MLSSDGEREIVKWIDNLRAEGAPVSAFKLQRKALEIAAGEGLSKDAFIASCTFRKGFLRRHMLSLRRHTRQGQKPPAESDVARAEFRVIVRDLMKEHAVDRVYNADQTAVFFEYLPKQTISGRGAKTVWVRCAGKEKERVTVMLLGDSCGTCYTPFVIAKAKKSEKEDTAVENKAIRHGFGIGVWKEVVGLQNRLDVIMYGNPKGWWNGELSLEVLRFHFASRPNRDQPVLLLWDDLSAHWTKDVQAYAKELNVVLIPVPPGCCTSVCQPVDISWNMPLKARLRSRWLENLQAQLRAPRQPGIKFKLAAPKRKDVTEWVVAAWEDLSPAVIKSGFSFIFKGAAASEEITSTAQPSDVLQTSTAVADALQRLGQLDRHLGEVQDDRDVVENAAAGVFEVLLDD
ncbi:hypothetical protein PR002_g28826 [Phytophthora rubi]|uniref:HTH CENPB-type domain-containing protein n=1 Tax=Phytophthora rubi TaxID=129364 RepID=A0A6A3H7K3_9STRA|nr:hypothetical protein PR002_g28826 [Phytophthora rubi]